MYLVYALLEYVLFHSVVEVLVLDGLNQHRGLLVLENFDMCCCSLICSA